MTDYEPLNIKADTKERLMSHKQHKRDTQDDVVNQVLDRVEGKESDTREQTIDVEDAQVLSRVLEERLAPWFEDTQDAVKEATDAAQNAERSVEELR